MSDKIDILINLIDRARKEVNALNSKGWYFHNHQFIFNPIISDDEIRSIEDKYRILFPSEYKEFLKRIGNGGSQPAYGMLTAEESAAVHSPRLASPGVFENNELVSYYSDLADIDSKISCGSDEKEFDDYLNLDTNKFIYGDLYSFNLDEYNIVDRRMRDHLLVFSYYHDTNTDYAIVLDGIYKDQVVYFNSHSFLLTHMSFLDWLIAFYETALECKKYYFLSLGDEFPVPRGW